MIRYAYLWKRDYEQGREEGSRDRPCAILIAVTDDEDEGLDGERSRIVISEVNEFISPGPDLPLVSGGDESSVVEDVLPPRFFAHARAIPGAWRAVRRRVRNDRMQRSARYSRRFDARVSSSSHYSNRRVAGPDPVVTDARSGGKACPIFSPRAC